MQAHFALVIPDSAFEFLSRLNRAIQEKWKDLPVIFTGIRYDKKSQRHLDGGGYEIDKQAIAEFKTVTFYKVQVMRSMVDGDWYIFAFRVVGNTKVEDAEE